MKETNDVYTKEAVFSSADFPLRIMYSKPHEMARITGLHMHDFLEFVLVIGGYGIHQSGNKVFPIMQGDVIAVPEQKKHSYASDDKLFIYNILFTREFLGSDWSEIERLPGLRTLLTEQMALRLPLPRYQEIKKLIHHLTEELQLRKRGFQIYCRALLIELLMELGRQETANDAWMRPAESEIRQNINEAIFLIQQDYQRDIPFDNLARRVRMGRSAFYAKFRQLTGVSPLEYQIKYRIEKAKILLRTTTNPVYHIAGAVGFSDASHMIRLFRKYNRITPVDYRQLQSPSDTGNAAIRTAQE